MQLGVVTTLLLPGAFGLPYVALEISSVLQISAQQLDLSLWIACGKDCFLLVSALALPYLKKLLLSMGIT